MLNRCGYIVRKVREEGNQRVVNIPQRICTHLELGGGNYVYFEVHEGGIVTLAKFAPAELDLKGVKESV